MKASSWIKAFVFLGIVGATAGWGWKHFNEGSATTYQTVPIDRGEVSSTIQASGSVNPVKTVQVGSQVSGNIQAIYVDFNSHVKAGDLIALIEPATLQSKVDSATANLEASHANVVNAQASMNGARADYASSQASLESQKANLLKSKVAMMDSKSKLDHTNELFKRGIVAGEER